MGLFGRLFSREKQKKPKKPKIERNLIPFYVKCDKCGEKITIRVNRLTDLQNLYLEQGEQGAAYNLKKEILGKKCPHLIRIDVNFDRAHRIISQEISGGKFISYQDLEE